MTLDEVKQRVKEVADCYNEDCASEDAHRARDLLYIDVLRHVADGHDGSVCAFAAEALRAEDVPFSRWYC